MLTFLLLAVSSLAHYNNKLIETQDALSLTSLKDDVVALKNDILSIKSCFPSGSAIKSAFSGNVPSAGATLGGALSTATCNAMWAAAGNPADCAITALNAALTKLKSLLGSSSANTVAISIGLTTAVSGVSSSQISLNSQTGIEVGIAIDMQKNKICYIGACDTAAKLISLGVSFGVDVGVWKDIGSIPGSSKEYEMNALASGTTVVTTNENIFFADLLGAVFSFDIGGVELGLSGAFTTHECFTWETTHTDAPTKAPTTTTTTKSPTPAANVCPLTGLAASTASCSEPGKFCQYYKTCNKCGTSVTVKGWECTCMSDGKYLCAQRGCPFYVCRTPAPKPQTPPPQPITPPLVIRKAMLAAEQMDSDINDIMEDLDD